MTCFFQSKLFMPPWPPPLPQPLGSVHPAGVKTGPAFVCEESVPPPSRSLLDPLQACQGFPRSGLCCVRAGLTSPVILARAAGAPSLPLISPSTKGSPVTQGDGRRTWIWGRVAMRPPCLGWEEAG